MRRHRLPPLPPAATDRSIAVLPFVNMSADKDQEYFADGISEELLNLLAKVPELRVIARTSSFSFKGKDVDIAEIARTLNVANVLEGSVRKSGDTVRITAQLIRRLRQLAPVVADLRPAARRHLRGAGRDRGGGGRGTQDQAARRGAKAQGTDPRAYALFLQARQIGRQFTPEALEQAIALYKQALAIDPNYAPAWDGLAGAYDNQVGFGYWPSRRAAARA